MGIVALTVHEHNKDLPYCYHFFINHLPEEEKAIFEKAAASMDSPLEVHLINDSCLEQRFSLMGPCFLLPLSRRTDHRTSC